MNRISLILISLLSIVFSIQFAKSQTQYTKNITLESVKVHIDTLASESLKGRDTGSEGQKIAAQYISDIFKKSGLKSFEKKGYLKSFALYNYKNGYSLLGTNQENLWDSYYAGSRNVLDSASLEFAFAGYGNDKDLIGLNTENKIITLVADNARLGIEKINQIAQIDKPTYFLVALPTGSKRFKSKDMMDFDTYFSLLIYAYYNAGEMKDSAEFADFFATYNLFDGLKIKSDNDVRVFFISQDYLGTYFNKSSENLIELAKQNQKSDKNLLLDVNGKTIDVKIDFNPEIVITQTENVVGYIEGTEKKDEFVVVSGHYDHVGVNYNGGINYGADDNATGTGAVLEIARQFAQAKNDGVQFKRSILFLTVSAEEKGLYGSKAFVDKALIPLKNIKLVINLDMIGRNRENDDKYNNTVFVAAWEGGKKFKRITKTENKNNINLKVDFTPGLYHKMLWRYSSDHYSFVQKNVPALVFFTGLHPDYHTPRDTPDKINYDKYYRIVQLIFETTWEVVNK